MTSNLAQDWVVYVLLGAVVWFFIYVIIASHKGDGRNRNQAEGKK